MARVNINRHEHQLALAAAREGLLKQLDTFHDVILDESGEYPQLVITDVETQDESGFGKIALNLISSAYAERRHPAVQHCISRRRPDMLVHIAWRAYGMQDSGKKGARPVARPGRED